MSMRPPPPPSQHARSLSRASLPIRETEWNQVQKRALTCQMCSSLPAALNAGASYPAYPQLLFETLLFRYALSCWLDLQFMLIKFDSGLLRQRLSPNAPPQCKNWGRNSHNYRSKSHNCSALLSTWGSFHLPEFG